MSTLPPPVSIPIVSLPSGGFVEFMPASQVTERSRRPIRTAMAKFSTDSHAKLRAADGDGAALAPDDFSAEEQELMYEINDLVAVAVIKSASFLPEGARCTVDDLQNQPAADYDKIIVAVSPLMQAIMSGVDFDPVPTAVDSGSPTLPSSD